MLQWRVDRAEIAKHIETRRAPVKVVLKTRNETEMLRRWVQHHLGIFGPGTIIIFDHQSTDPETLSIYEAYADQLEVFQFDHMHNSIHNPRIFPRLYRALRKSAAYYIFLDTDEFLYWHAPDHRMVCDPSLVDHVLQSGEKVLPGLWVENVRGSPHDFRLSFKRNKLRSGLRGGKPMISTKVKVSDFSNHNSQIDPELFRGCRTANLVVLHLKNLSVEQRIHTNLQKLQSYNQQSGVLEPLALYGRAFGLEDVLSVDETVLPKRNARRYITEVKALHAARLDPEMGKPRRAPDASLVDGRLQFRSRGNERLIRAFFDDPSGHIEDTLVHRGA